MKFVAPVLAGVALFLAPGAAYAQLAPHPRVGGTELSTVELAAQNGTLGRARILIDLLQATNLAQASREFYNALEAPALDKYPVLKLYQEFLRAHGAIATLMSGSGSTTFALFREAGAAEDVVEKFKTRFGGSCWTAVVPV